MGPVRRVYTLLTDDGAKDFELFSGLVDYEQQHGFRHDMIERRYDRDDKLLSEIYVGAVLIRQAQMEVHNGA